MPYIKQEDQKHCTPDTTSDYTGPNNAGELNYTLTKVCQDYFYYRGARYQQINDILGALEGCKLEFYRRLVAPYENTKIKENGDVY